MPMSAAERIAGLNERAKMLAFVLEVQPNNVALRRRLRVVKLRLAAEMGKRDRNSLARK
jgi:hypothetical protein